MRSHECETAYSTCSIIIPGKGFYEKFVTESTQQSSTETFVIDFIQNTRPTMESIVICMDRIL